MQQLAEWVVFSFATNSIYRDAKYLVLKGLNNDIVLDFIYQAENNHFIHFALQEKDKNFILVRWYDL